MPEEIYLLADSIGPPDEVKSMEDFLKRYVKGQDRAIESVAKYLGHSITLGEIEERTGPIMVLLFLGPSGVGKTEIARTLALYFHGSRRAMQKIDCAEMKMEHQTSTLIGSPPGYVGYNEEAMLSPESIEKSKRVNNNEGSDDNGYKNDEYFKEQIKLGIEIKKVEREWRTDQRLLATLQTEMELLLKGLEQARNDREADFIRDGIFEVAERVNELKDNTILIIKRIQKNRIRIEELATKAREQSGGKQTKSASYDGKKPAIVLFDEIEKAHEAVHDLLLQIMEDGGVTLGNGNYSDLRNTILILTSNVGSREITNMLKERGHIGFHTEVSHKLDKDVFEVARAELEKHFKTAFIGRLDSVVAFRHLTKEDYFNILDKEITLFAEKLLARTVDRESLPVKLEVSPEARKFIVESSTSRPELGARLLRHKFQTILKMALGNILYNTKNFTGDVMVVYDDVEKKIAFRLSKTPLLEPIIEPDPDPNPEPRS